MSKIPNLTQLLEDLTAIKEKIYSVDKDMELMRNYYKHEDCTPLDCASEEAIGNWQYVKDIDSVISFIEEIVNYECYYEELEDEKD